MPSHYFPHPTPHRKFLWQKLRVTPGQRGHMMEANTTLCRRESVCLPLPFLSWELSWSVWSANNNQDIRITLNSNYPLDVFVLSMSCWVKRQTRGLTSMLHGKLPFNYSGFGTLLNSKLNCPFWTWLLFFLFFVKKKF